MTAARDDAFAAGVVHGQKALQAITGPLQVVDSPELAELRAENARLRSDAQVAMALVVEQAAGLPCAIIPYSPENKAALDAVAGYRDAIRALADVDGLAEVAKLRAENHAVLGDYRTQHKRAERLAADLAAALEREAALREALWAADDYIDKGLYEMARNVTRAALGAKP